MAELKLGQAKSRISIGLLLGGLDYRASIFDNKGRRIVSKVKPSFSNSPSFLESKRLKKKIRKREKKSEKEKERKQVSLHKNHAA